VKKKSEFVRTPKYHIVNKKGSWMDKKYTPVSISFTVVLESILSLYCLFGVAASIYFVEIAAVPFQLMFSGGFGAVAILSIKHARDARKLRPLVAGDQQQEHQLEKVAA